MDVVAPVDSSGPSLKEQPTESERRGVVGSRTPMPTRSCNGEERNHAHGRPVSSLCAAGGILTHFVSL
jgi:hypothetical protein